MGRRGSGPKSGSDTPLAMRLSVWLVFLILVALFYLGNHPIVIENEPIPFKPYEITRSLNADVIVVVDYEVIRKSPDNFSEKDWSAVWIDTFEQEIGPISVATPETLTPEMLGSCRWLVLTHSAASTTPDGLVDQIRSRVRDGMFLILDRPKGRLRDTFSADGEGTEREPSGISFASDLLQPFSSHLENAPLFGSYITSRGAREHSVTHLAFDGAPVVYVSQFGDGFAMTIDFDFAEWLVSLQQGRPKNDFVVDISDSVRDTVLTADLVADKKLEGANVPYADLLEHFLIWRVASTHAPIAGFWPFPDQKAGAVLLIHDDAAVGQKARWLAEFENERNASSTFLRAWDTPAQDGQTKDLEFEVGFLWRSPGTRYEQTERLGIAGWEPLSRPVGLIQQFNVAKSSARAGLSTSQMMGSTWRSEWDGPFRDLAAINVRIDTSYSVPKTNGFSFGTGFPFLVMSREGIPVGMRELPIVVEQGARRGPTFEELLQTTQQYHVPIAYRMSADWFSERPDQRTFVAWRDLLESFEDHNVFVSDVRKFDLFSRARRASGIRSKLNPAAMVPWLPRRPSENKRGEPTAVAAMLRVSAQAKTVGMSIVVPEKFGEKSVFTVREKAKKIEDEFVAAELDSSVTNLVGIGLRLIPVNRGFSTVDVYYR